jgi:uncharacterized membrane protein YjgN (DUF898 family)
MKTRLRRWYWSAIRPGSDPMEYTGTAMEKLLGFLIAVVVLAFYLGIFNLILMFVSFSLLANNFAAYAISFLGVIPLWFYARYRARRYVLARTRWRGVRFGLEQGAWGYALRALGHWLVVIVTAGLLLPRLTFGLEKYITNRTFFGSARLNQSGRWTMLYPAFAPLILGVVFSVGCVLVGAQSHENFLWMLILTVPLSWYGWIYYQVETRRLMANEKTAEGVGLIAQPRAKRVFAINLLGYTAITIVLAVLMVPLAYVVAAVQAEKAGFGFAEAYGFVRFFMGLPEWVTLGIGLAVYFVSFLLLSVLRHVWITMPTMRHYAQTLTLTQADALHGVSQRARDEFAEAEGFAEALDVGAAI